MDIEQHPANAAASAHAFDLCNPPLEGVLTFAEQQKRAPIADHVKDRRTFPRLPTLNRARERADGRCRRQSEWGREYAKGAPLSAPSKIRLRDEG